MTTLRTNLPPEGLFSRPVDFQGNLAVVRDAADARNQAQTNAAFSDKWLALDGGTDTSVFESFQKDWLLALYGFEDVDGLRRYLADRRVIIDAGCGLGYKSAWLAELAPHATVIGVDFSESAYVAARRYADVPNLWYLRADIADLPLAAGSVDFILCDQVIHHTEEPRRTFAHLASLLSASGELACYVYARKALPRELVDDYFRSAAHDLSQEEMWELSRQLTELGKRLTELQVSFDAPDIPALGIKGGTYDIQRFIYWNFLKCFYRPGWAQEVNDATNFDWYAPSNAARYTPQEFRAWADEDGLEVRFFRSEEACHTLRAGPPLT
jgi:SAM-dependent methyltransferase